MKILSLTLQKKNTFMRSGTVDSAMKYAIDIAMKYTI